jgi:hypothetical protein
MVMCSASVLIVPSAGRSDIEDKHEECWKTDLIEKTNPAWKDLYEDLLSGFPGQAGE